MGYLNKATITVDAILTNRGRQLLAESGQTGLQITKFAVADDEIDYGLYDPSNKEGTEYYGNVIENMPLLEATPDEQQIMRYKLVSLDSAEFGSAFVQDDGTVRIPTINGFTDQTLNSANTDEPFQIATNPQFAEGYTLIIADATLFRVTNPAGTTLNTTTNINANGSITLKFENTSATPVNLFNFVRTNKTGTTTATLYGNRTGATKSITITVE